MPPAEERRRLHRVLDETQRRLRAAARTETILILVAAAALAVLTGTLGSWARLSTSTVLLVELLVLALGGAGALWRWTHVRREALADRLAVGQWIDRALGTRDHPPKVSFRSAVELERDRGRFGESAELADEAIRSAGRHTRTFDHHELVRKQLRPRIRISAGAMGVLFTSLLLLAWLRTGDFRHALFAVGQWSSLEEALLPSVPEPHLGDIKLSYRYPAYTRRPPRTVRSLTGDIRALPGTEVTIETQARELLSKASLVVSYGEHEEEGQSAAVEIQGHRLRANLIINRAGRYRLDAKSATGEVLEQRRGQAIELELDAPPEVVLRLPEESPIEVNEKDSVPVSYSADDDFGLGDIRVAWRVLGTARQGTQRLTSAARGRARYRGDGGFELAELGLKPGDRVAYSIEALDNDTVNGPKVGASDTKELVVYSKEAHHREVLALQEKALDELVHLLGDNLDNLFGLKEAEAYDALLTVSQKIVDRAQAANTLLKETVEAIQKDPLGREAVATAFDRARQELLSDARRKQRSLRDAQRSFRSQKKPSELHTSVVVRNQGRMVEDLEKNVVYLADLLNDQRMIDAESLMKQLREQQQALREALEQYKNAPSEEQRQALEAAIKEIRQRIQDITSQLAQMRKSIPSEFVNADALSSSDNMASMDRMQQMIEEGDLDGAMAELDQMLNGTEQMISQMQEGRQEIGSREYSEITELADQVWKELDAVQKDQEQLAERNEQISRSVLEKMKDRLGNPESFIKKQLDRIAEAAKSIEQAEPGAHTTSGDAYDNLLRRLDDTSKALQANDFGAAKEMIDRGLENMRQVQDETERRLENAERFGDWFGSEMEIGKSMRELRRASPKLEAVSKDIENLMPNPSELLAPSQKSELDRLAERQRKISEQTEGLGQKLDQLSEMLPIVGEGTKKLLDDAKGAMKNAQRGLQQGDSPGASGDQQRALQSLDELKESLQQMGQQGQGGGSGGVPLPFGGSPMQPGGGEGDGRQLDPREKVEIPQPEQFQAPAEFREDILDAAKKGTVESYRDAVRRYYEEIIK